MDAAPQSSMDRSPSDIALVDPIESIFQAKKTEKVDRDERRIAVRRIVTVPGAITFEDGRAKLYCVIRDVSDTGARLNLPRDAKIPAEFDLWLVQKNLSRRVCLKWRKGDLAGVAFI